MKLITYNGETHNLEKWIEILNLSEEGAGGKELIDFATELIFKGKITNENLYEAYTLWCDETPLAPSVFAKRIAIIFKKYRPDLQRFRTCKVRGWQNK